MKADSHRNVQTRIYHGDCWVRAIDPSMPFCILFPLKERSLLVRNALWLFLGSVVGGISRIPKVSSSYFSSKRPAEFFFMRLAHQGFHPSARHCTDSSVSLGWGISKRTRVWRQLHGGLG